MAKRKTFFYRKHCNFIKLEVYINFFWILKGWILPYNEPLESNYSNLDNELLAYLSVTDCYVVAMERWLTVLLLTVPTTLFTAL